VEPIREHGIIGNCRTAALVSRTGAISWLCLPRFDSPSVFASILDAERGGSFAIRPGVVGFRSRQGYLDGTNVLETRFETSGGAFRLLDCFSVRGEADRGRELWPDHEILRVVEGVSGRVPVRLQLSPRPGYGGSQFRWRRASSNRVACEFGAHIVHLIAERAVRLEEAGAICEFVVRAGERVIFSLSHQDGAPAVIPPLGDYARERLDRTVRYWQRWIAHCRYAGPYADQVRRSALALKLLVFAPSGAVIAAPTTSLPEAPGGVRNWDYRFCWLRDASFTVRALLALGYTDEARSYAGWLLHSTRLTRPRLQVVYSVFGESKLVEREIPWLSGYSGARPVRVGNAASHQRQNDIYGEVLDAYHSLLPHLDRIDSDTRKLLIGMGRVLEREWEKPDQGIWEFRDGRGIHTHSRMMAWVGLDRLQKIADRHGWNTGVACRSVSEKIRRSIDAHGFDARLGSYVRRFGEAELDASLLTMPILGYEPPDSPRVLGTLAAVGSGLSRDGLLYRYRPGSDGLPGREGAFGLCNFWMAEAWALAGRTGEARRWIEAMLRYANDVALWPEELAPGSGEYLGNYPQGFTHIGLINASLALERAERERKRSAA
jgi:GH15 family glucan-1,4-alpha-glucosidase